MATPKRTSPHTKLSADWSLSRLFAKAAQMFRLGYGEQSPHGSGCVPGAFGCNLSDLQCGDHREGFGEKENSPIYLGFLLVRQTGLFQKRPKRSPIILAASLRLDTYRTGVPA
jgi:hypothetical protein